jgi:hypothetical protein
MLNSYVMMSKLLKNNLFDTAETYKEFNRRFTQTADYSDETDTDNEPEEREPHIVEKIIQLIEPFFALIAQKSPAATIAATGLKQIPQFLDILKDPVLCRNIVNHFDKTKGRQQSDIALRNIGIDRQKLFAQRPAAPGTPQPAQKPTQNNAGPAKR